ncbi:cupin domain-containing protein [Thermopolyspora sp. NPDC052614]|uniref:1,2-dihydroxy-3-keto-5-methylthiopentene dioxygenase n=1 Tax=Thermopolyspora sp. NPDC052614 TaxID=3155682 RepID=UPI00341CE954
MTYLTVYTDSDAPETLLETEDLDEIDAALKEIDVRLRHWPVLDEDAVPPDQEGVLDAYKDEVARIVAEEGYVFVDVSSLRRTDETDQEWAAKAAEARRKFLSEHTHDDDEVRFFVSGTGIFYLHVNGKVHAVFCEAGDLLSVPKGTTHWFDMGTDPAFTAIRFFHDDDGWVGNFTGDPISERIPDYDAIAARRAAR